MRAAAAPVWRVLRVLATGAVVVMCLLWGQPAYADTATPAPYPTEGGSPLSWSCADSSDGATPPATGSACVVTEWGVDPVPAPPPAPGDPAPALSDAQYDVLSFGVGLLVFLSAARLIGSWR